MNHRCACTWVRTRRAVVLAALTLLVVGCGATGSAVDTTAEPTTTTPATTTATAASAHRALQRGVRDVGVDGPGCAGGVR